MHIVSLEPDSTWAPAAQELLRTRSGPGRLVPDPRPDLWQDWRGQALSCLLALEDGKPAGFVSVGADGRIAEWVIAGDAGRNVSRALLAAAERRARESGAVELHFFRAPGERPSAAALIDQGFRSVAPPSTTLRVLDIPAFLAALAARSAAPLPRRPFTLLLRISPDRFRADAEPDVAILAGPGGRRITTGVPESVDARVGISARALTAFLLGGRAEPFRVEPASRAEAATAVLKALALDTPWSTPLGDRR